MIILKYDHDVLLIYIKGFERLMETYILNMTRKNKWHVFCSLKCSIVKQTFIKNVNEKRNIEVLLFVDIALAKLLVIMERFPLIICNTKLVYQCTCTKQRKNKHFRLSSYS